MCFRVYNCHEISHIAGVYFYSNTFLSMHIFILVIRLDGISLGKMLIVLFLGSHTKVDCLLAPENADCLNTVLILSD